MIAATDLHDKAIFINADHIECIESNPDTQIVLNNGNRYYVAETPEEIAKRFVEYKRSCLRDDLPGS
jgi:flagellar protein FlbD